MKIQALVHSHTQHLTPFSDTPQLDAEMLVCHVVNISKETLFTHPELEITQEQAEMITDLVQKRSKGMPVAYLTQQKEFFGRNFYVDNRVLIPRPETELLIETVLKFLKKELSHAAHKYRLIDVGTGSGCIIVTLILELLKQASEFTSELAYYALDISAEALEVARKNAQTFQIQNKLHFLQSDLLSALEPEANVIDIIISNPPYAAMGDAVSHSTSFEPQDAIFAGRDGLMVYKKLLEQMRHFPVAAFFFECGLNQAPLLKNEIAQAFPKIEIHINKDLAGIERVIAATKTSDPKNNIAI